ncbi:winged helix-turn-helix domain-containing protein [Neptunicoccus sediminis]|uniref:winged helix-turn-helix domain-containing protein n=1 Tax=Neptunicoccus sediminis TaxID=1892596 RepID=UPI0009F2043B|nr:LysR family transcriptional regulator [Neptunicoccus sediminis]
MSIKKNNRRAERIAQTPQLRAKVLVRNDMIGAGKIELLRRISETGSISAAAKDMGLGYRRALFLLETTQRMFDAPLLITERGGNRAGSRLTPLGLALVERHRAFEQALEQSAAGFLDWLEAHQNQDPLPDS